MKGNCAECSRRWVCNIDPDEYDAFPDPPPMTNADRIRAMSDEELAEWIARTQIGAIKDAMTILQLPYAEGDEIVVIEKTEALQWLQQPYEEDCVC